MSMDYVNISIIGQVVSVPIEKGSNGFFKIQNTRGNYVSEYAVLCKDLKQPLDVNLGDKVVITNAGQFIKDQSVWITLTENSSLEVIRKRCNMGVKEV